MGEALVSVCIPVYNGEKYIGETIDSVLKQNYENFELIICDNNSSDKTVDIVRSKADSRIQLYENATNIGMFGNMNKSISLAKGDYIQILCADDMLEPSCLKKKAEALNNHSNASFVFSNTYIVNEDNKVLMERKPLRKSGVYDGISMAKKSYRRHNCFGEPSNVMFRKSFATEISGFNKNITYSADWEYWIRLAEKGSVVYINEALSRFRISTEHASSNMLRNYRLLLNDEKNFTKSIKSSDILEIKKIDIIQHKVSIISRNMGKLLFTMIVKKREKQ